MQGLAAGKDQTAGKAGGQAGLKIYNSQLATRALPKAPWEMLAIFRSHQPLPYLYPSVEGLFFLPCVLENERGKAKNFDLWNVRISKRGLGFCYLMVILGCVTSYPSNTDRIMTAT